MNASRLAVSSLAAWILTFGLPGCDDSERVEEVSTETSGEDADTDTDAQPELSGETDTEDTEPLSPLEATCTDVFIVDVEIEDCIEHAAVFGDDAPEVVRACEDALEDDYSRLTCVRRFGTFDPGRIDVGHACFHHGDNGLLCLHLCGEESTATARDVTACANRPAVEEVGCLYDVCGE